MSTTTCHITAFCPMAAIIYLFAEAVDVELIPRYVGWLVYPSMNQRSYILVLGGKFWHYCCIFILRVICTVGEGFFLFLILVY